MAQLVEQRIRNAWVAGSSPASGSTKKRTTIGSFFFALVDVNYHVVINYRVVAF